MYFVSELEGFMGDKAFPFYSDSNLTKESSFGQIETDVEMGLNREVNDVLPSSTQFPNLEPLLYVDMSPSVLESSQESEPENGGTVDTIPLNQDVCLPPDLDISLPPEIISKLNEIVPHTMYDLANNSDNLDISLMESILECPEVDNNSHMESVSTPIINDTMMSPTTLGIHHQEPPTAAASTAHLDPPTISIPEEEQSIIPPEIEEMFSGLFEKNTLTAPLEDVEMTENFSFDQNIISNGTDDMELPTSAGQEDLLERALQKCLGPQDLVCYFDFSCILVTDVR